VDLEALKAVLGDDVAGLMLTNPNTVGIFDENILEITRLVHEAGGLCYYDGANLNAVMGIVRPGDMGFDCIHMNLHKTFATPHGGGGPGAGAVGCKAFLEPYLPQSAILSEGEHLQVRAFNGNFLVVVKALADRDMSRAELAATVGTSPQYMSYILNGTRSGEKYLPAIIAALALDPKKAERAIAA
jgi:glycine dehydrogenase subunit 2